MASKSQDTAVNILCFAGAEYDLPSWTNRQHIMSRFSKQYPVLYVEPRVWIISYLWRNKLKPKKILSWLKKIVWYEKKSNNLYIKAQWNLIPGSREIKSISTFNHFLNRWCVLSTAWWLGFRQGKQVMWIYDTEAAEYLSAFKKATIVYDCVDDHAVQSGVDRNAARVHQEEKAIQDYADLVTVTSQQLYKMKKDLGNVHLVLNSGDVELFQDDPSMEAKDAAGDDIAVIPKPIFGTVGALDSYKVNFPMLAKVAKAKPNWQFVFIGNPVIKQKDTDMQKLKELENVHFLGTVNREYVPAYVQYFDVCMIPYNYNKYNQSSFPLKFWEFMATGKPVIVTGLPELKEYSDIIGYGKDHKDFIRMGETALQNPALNSDTRVRLSQKHTWDKRAARLMELLLAEIKDN